MPDTMRAVVAEPGGRLRLTSLPLPRPAAGEVLVRVHASAVNPLDTKILAEAAAHARQPLPAILGLDMAGEVATPAAGFAEGEAVFAMAGGVGGVPGALAEYTAVDARLLARKPSTLSMREAAALPLAFITAWEGLVDRVGLRAGQSVAVLGGAGGVGQMALQIARARGAGTWASGSPRARAAIEALGARFFDKAEPPSEVTARETAGRGFDVVFDTAGGASLDAGFALVSRFGHVVSALGWGAHALAPLSFKAASYSGIFMLTPLLTGEGRERHGAILAEAARMAEAGALKPALDARRYTLETVGEAYRAIETGAAGKLVVDIGDEHGDR